ncbi:glycosyltransferase [Agrobacterium salinitolerans]|uniref:Glycosyltransferase n=1 Tax=Agrobacterium salinitolerans TaxID=1183413 RepID=A0A9X3R1F9_9HYPH|nr:glycosyltransferase [Agrobacterium salinitolerans]MCZ7940431.1 glycosyltransferase [Agrobacterium salinitolerans]
MKIIHVIASIDPKHGGLQAVAMRLAAAQAGLGLDVNIVSYGDAAIEAQVKEIGRSIPHFENIHWHLLEPAGRLETLFCFRGRRMLKALLKDASFMHIHGVWEPFLLYASKLARAAGVPYCICPAGMLDHWSLGQRSWKKKIALMLCYRRMLNEAAFLHLLNVDEMAAVEPLNFQARNLIIPNGVFAEEFDPLPTRGHFRQKIALAHGRRYILFLSRLHIKKGIDILASAFAAISDTYVDVDLVVAGPPGGAEGHFMHLVKKLNIRHRVFMVGAIYGETKLEAMVDADCFCLPSRQEGFSMAITEALACGTPVVITDQCHFPEVGSADAGLIVSVDAAEVAKALASVLGNPARARTMGENGRRLVLERFTWPTIAHATLEGYRLSALEAAAS